MINLMKNFTVREWVAIIGFIVVAVILVREEINDWIRSKAN